MAVQRAEFNGIPAWLLADYLVSLGGEADDGTVRGKGWTARLTAAVRAPGSLALGRVLVEVEGPASEDTIAALRIKARRGGG
jgi:hypothetical protein